MAVSIDRSDVDRETSVGCKLLIHDGAHPVLDPDDLIEELAPPRPANRGGRGRNGRLNPGIDAEPKKPNQRSTIGGSNGFSSTNLREGSVSGCGSVSHDVVCDFRTFRETAAVAILGPCQVSNKCWQLLRSSQWRSGARAAKTWSLPPKRPWNLLPKPRQLPQRRTRLFLSRR